MRITLITIAIFIASLSIVAAQGIGSGGTIKDDGRFAASTKQLNQFFRRFNAEESPDGNTRFYTGDSLFQNKELRRQFIQRLFDNETSGISADLKNQFIKQVLSDNYPQYLKFHLGDWFSEVKAQFMFQGKRETATLILKIQPQGLGYEWVIDAVDFGPFRNLFDKPVGDEKDFLHPLSHELGFMNLRRAFQDSELPEAFTESSFSPDYLTIFLYEMKKGNLKFETVSNVKFHFFQIDGWYFEVAQFNRPGFNTGWLISSLVKLNTGDKETLQKYIYGSN
ncbi:MULTISPECIES: hypothetical protein [Algoriphagus]|uniref:Uncharacterized protein n=2 Tax=Algoriphagus TaxID=246875 RepID=A0ABS7N3I0_9BACT|nr:MULTISPECIES: hypothetical protein [Algoriphagus]MBY5950876.1 hypothetical protein [Algoriphagus marincola]TDK47352.1 hypothetical protein E1898_05665 [Algoriphagus aquimaris]